MPRTYFADLIRDNGLPVTIEYSFACGSETTYSPLNGAESGDPAEASIVTAFDDDGDVELTDAESERFEEHIIGTHVEDFDDGDRY